MTRKLKTGALILVMSGAMSALLAPASSAAEFHSESAHTILSAAQTEAHQISAGSGFGAISCSTSSISGTTSSTTESTETVEINYSNCKDSFGRTAHYFRNGCTGIFSLTSRTEGHLGIICSLGQKVEFTITTGGGSHCTMTIPPQTGIQTIKFHRVGSGWIIFFGVFNLKTITHGGFFNCGVSNGEHTSGTYSGSSQMSGTDTAGNSVNIFTE